MTPKEKAEELINKMHNTEHCYIKHIPNQRYCDCISMNAFQAKQCALKAVDEIIEIFEFMVASNLQNHQFMAILNYWDEVRKEIEKL